MIVKLKLYANLDSVARRILDNAARVARRCAAWPAWKRGEHMTKKNLLDPSNQIAKALGARKICTVCAPFERARLTGRGPQPHPRCEDVSCGCSCWDGRN